MGDLEHPSKRPRLGPLRECQLRDRAAPTAPTAAPKRSAGCEAPTVHGAGKLTRTSWDYEPVDVDLQQHREGLRDMFSATQCACCGVAYQTLERRAGAHLDEPYCQFCMWADVGLICRSCCRGGAGHP